MANISNYANPEDIEFFMNVSQIAGPPDENSERAVENPEEDMDGFYSDNDI